MMSVWFRKGFVSIGAIVKDVFYACTAVYVCVAEFVQ